MEPSPSLFTHVQYPISFPLNPGWSISRSTINFTYLLGHQQPMKLKKPSVISVISKLVAFPIKKKRTPTSIGKGQPSIIFWWQKKQTKQHFTIFYQGKQPLLLHHDIEMMHPSPVFVFWFPGKSPTVKKTFRTERTPTKTARLQLNWVCWFGPIQV